MAWNEATERKFLLCTLDNLPKNPDWDLMSARMGPSEFTASACRWNAETERMMLLVTCVELRPNPATWQIVADRLGGGLNANAVSQKFYKLKKEAAEIQKFETPKRDAPKGNRNSTGTGTGTKRKREKNVEASRETPSKPSKKQMTPIDLDALAADDDGETKPYGKGVLKMETDEDEEMEDEGRNAEEA